MNLSDDLILGTIISSVSILIGWMLNQFSQWFRTRKEDKKKLKEILYFLLELYNLFTRSDINKFVGNVKDVVMSWIPDEEKSKEGVEFMDKIYGNIADQFVRPEILQKLEAQLNNYENAVRALASINPILAYCISSKNNINQTFQQLERVYDGLETEYEQQRKILRQEKIWRLIS